MDSKIFLYFSPDNEQTLEQNNIKIDDILLNEGLDVKLQEGVVTHIDDKDNRTKDIVTVVLASSALILSIAYSVSLVLNSLNNKKQVIEYEVLEELRENGKVVKNSEGLPIFKTVKKIEIVDPTQKPTNTIEFEGFNFFRIFIKSK